MSKNTIIFLRRVADHCHITGKEEADVLAKKVILITESTDREISCCQNHNLIGFKDVDRLTDVQERCINVGETELQTDLTCHISRPSQTFVCFLDMIALRNICIM
jgi:hypothetical protein